MDSAPAAAPHGEGPIKGFPTHGGRYVQYNVYGNFFEVTAKYVPPLRPIGRGAYGIVCAAVNSQTREEVAIKKIGNAFDNRIDAKRTLREIKLLRHMDHENVIAIKDIIRPPKRENFNDVYIVYELMDTDLHQIIRSNQPLTDDHCQYTASIDIWSVGCILGEIVTREPLFPGKDYVHQLRLITELIGSPDDSSLGFLRSDNARRYVRQLPQYPKQEFCARFPTMSIGAIDLLEKMLVFDPSKRITVNEALQHPYLASLHDINDEPFCPAPFSFDFEHPSYTEEDIKELIWRESLKFNPDPLPEEKSKSTTLKFSAPKGGGGAAKPSLSCISCCCSAALSCNLSPDTLCCKHSSTPNASQGFTLNSGKQSFPSATGHALAAVAISAAGTRKLLLDGSGRSRWTKSPGESRGSVVFLDGSSQRYIRKHPQDASGKLNSMSSFEVAATMSVLLGFAPPSLLPADSSSKLNKVLLPNPFDRPHALFMLEISGIEQPLLSAENLKSQTSNVFSSRISGSSTAKLELPGEDQVSVVPLDDPLDLDCDAACLDKELKDLANWMGGSYVGTIKSQDGKLTVPLATGSTLNLHVVKKADLQFASGIVSLIRNVKRTVEFHEDLSESNIKLSEIMTGRFTGIEALIAEYGWGDISHQGAELLQTILLKLSDMLQVSYRGKIVGVVILTNEPSSESGMLVDVTSTAQISRLLEEESSATSSDSEVLLVRRSLAWITGVILLISTLIGVYLLLNMPLTRDTLLYSNVKLD
ncbi:hypothetical protein C4D60_Mb04t11910 [Musa balbisiana]|uniref:Protein kinase domain-containing protein n=1 Tax=Musa balbisiana TaxID=52838 RepID=A0A4S8KBE7_MUSBA|nr:hypothetical protein C4D60_Mb04t11910 [Musa balbisiana]